MKLKATLLTVFIGMTSSVSAQYSIRDDGWTLKHDGLKLTASANFGDDAMSLSMMEISCGADGFHIGFSLRPKSLGDADFKKIRSAQIELRTRDQTFNTSGSIIGETILVGSSKNFEEKEFLELLRRLYDLRSVAITVEIKDGHTISGLWLLNPWNPKLGGYDASNAFGRMTSMCPTMLRR
ncbi:hypothetical protein [Methylobacterium nodulans]|uniref:Uncharacterized protein n=1 Tax=Methylobacterium nodulans (strain LMG 21967 / CNCM I-2342 / ORS 2060) TaxID=460265 RepID=B8IWK0_METNO|nr:hypothetical protein [Methylobacterium nodulans]ACL62790.1 hypothetical protein Mnod_8734 [Methylobacterium nodulans ORS 2060]